MTMAVVDVRASACVLVGCVRVRVRVSVSVFFGGGESNVPRQGGPNPCPCTQAQ